MRPPKHLLAWILACLHLAFCAVFFFNYFRSTDPNRAMALIIFVFVDPWFLPWVKLADFISPNYSDAFIVVSLAVLGTLQWWAIGWLLSKFAQKSW